MQEQNVKRKSANDAKSRRETLDLITDPQHLREMEAYLSMSSEALVSVLRQCAAEKELGWYIIHHASAKPLVLGDDW